MDTAAAGSGDTPLRAAIRGGHAAAVRELVEAGAALSRADRELARQAGGTEVQHALRASEASAGKRAGSCARSVCCGGVGLGAQRAR